MVNYFFELEKSLNGNSIKFKPDDTMTIGKGLFEYNKTPYMPSTPFNERLVLYGRGIATDNVDLISGLNLQTASLRNTVAQKFDEDVSGNWIKYVSSMIEAAHVSKSAQEFGDWFIERSFSHHQPELHAVDDNGKQYLYVTGGVHRLALLDLIQYNKPINTKYFILL